MFAARAANRCLRPGSCHTRQPRAAFTQCTSAQRPSILPNMFFVRLALPTQSRLFSVNGAENFLSVFSNRDTATVIARLQKMTITGAYPQKMFSMSAGGLD